MKIRSIIHNFLSVSAIAAAPLPHTTFEILDDEGEYRDLEVYVWRHSPCEFVHDLYIAELYRSSAIFSAADSLGLSSFTSAQRQRTQKIAVVG